jgi:hypothetical protein
MPQIGRVLLRPLAVFSSAVSSNGSITQRHRHGAVPDRACRSVSGWRGRAGYNQTLQSRALESRPELTSASDRSRGLVSDRQDSSSTLTKFV